MANLPAHLFLSESGDLHDTRAIDWAAKPLRTNYRCAFPVIRTVAELKATLRHGPHAWPGGYPLYFIASDGEPLSFAAVRDNLRNVMDSIRGQHRDGWRVVACDINWESDLTCAHTGQQIESAYGAEESA